MAQQGDRYVVELKEPHLQWGEYRYTDTRETVKDEGYIPIPLNDARRLELVNSNATGGKDILGKNLFRYTTCDGYCKGFLKAQGSSVGGSQYAKQFSQQGDYEWKEQHRQRAVFHRKQYSHWWKHAR